MTPGGYIDISAKEADLLLNGEDVFAHSGVSGTGYMISAEEVLKQEIYSVNQDKQNARFFMITDMPEKIITRNQTQQEHIITTKQIQN